MGKSRLTIWGILILAWMAFAAWQYYSWRTEQFLIRETVRQQADSVMQALTGGILSHRRLGRFVQQQLQGILVGLAEAGDVLAVEVATPDGRSLVAAGDSQLLPSTRKLEPGALLGAVRFSISKTPGD